MRLVGYWLIFATALSSMPSAHADEAFDAILKGDSARAYQLLKPRADAGDAQAEWELGTLYAEGHGVWLNCDLSRMWNRKAAAHPAETLHEKQRAAAISASLQSPCPYREPKGGIQILAAPRHAATSQKP